MVDHQIFDVHAYGRLLRAARIIAGYPRVEDVPPIILERTGVEMSPRTIYALERGEQTPTVPQYMALTVTLTPPTGLAYWEPCFSDTIRALISDRSQQHIHGTP